MTYKDWLLVSAWVLYVALLGPFLISAASNIAVILGLVILIGLIVVTFKRVKSYYEQVK
jgi:hypothetical protein